MLVTETSGLSRSSDEAKATQKFMLFDLDSTGHHSGYIQHLVNYWQEQQLPGNLDIVVSQEFIQKHPKVVELASESEWGRARFVAIRDDEQANLLSKTEFDASFKARVVRGFQEWELLRKYAIELGVDHCFAMYLDRMLLRLSVGGRLPCPLSAIYFRPLVHYGNFPTYTPEGKERMWYWRDRVCLSRLMQHRKLHTLFCLDGFAANHINQAYGTTKAAYLPDPVKIYDSSPAQVNELRTRLGVEPDRQVFLLFGALAERKGIYQLLDAIAQLTPDQCRRMTLLVIGGSELNPEEQQLMEAKIATLHQTLPVQIICSHDFILDQAIQGYFQLADVVLAPYQRHIGMSAILVRAAAAQKPVLASDFGLMGEVARQHHLGLTIDSTSPAAIAQGLTRYLTESHQTLGDQISMQRFAKQNTADQFASRIFACMQSK
jgi:glycosyltransferase involved in cell wall biosynthesis